MKPYYEESGITIYHGDCRDVLPLLPQDFVVDCCITDPPYDSFTHRGAFSKSARSIIADTSEMGIGFAPLNGVGFLVALMEAIVKNWMLAFCSLEMLGEYQVECPERYIRGGIWDRITNTPQISGDRPAQGGEGIAIFHARRGGRMIWNGGGKAAIWRHQVEAGLKYHPTQKPLSLMKELVGQFSLVGESILDPYMGGGSTLVAAKDLGRKAIGIEIEERYCEIAANRLRQEVLSFEVA